VIGEIGYVLHPQTLSAAFGERDNESAEILAVLCGADPSLGVEFLGVRKQG
jgi:hypothetical protein